MILVVDDDDTFRRVLGTELRGLGFEVVEASTGAEAVELLASAADGARRMPSLVVLDICMPEYSGLGVLGVARRFPRMPATFVVTGFPDPSLEVLARLRGARRVFHKPVDLGDLVNAITAEVDGSS